MTESTYGGYDGSQGPGEQAAVVRAAQVGDQKALNALVADYLPLIYNIVGRALNAPADTDDVVQEIMLQMIRDVRKLRDPEAFRPWLVAIAMRQVRRHWRIRRSTPVTAGLEGLEETALLADPGADFVDLTVLGLGLSDQRREVAEATRWLDADDRQLLSLWWLEAAGRLTRSELAAALELPMPQAAVRVQRMKAQLETARAVVRALRAVPRCPEHESVLRGWDGRPAGLWRKRIARHVRGCPQCGGLRQEVVPAERLLAGLALTPLPLVLLALARSGALDVGAGGIAGGGTGSGAAAAGKGAVYGLVRVGRSGGSGARTLGGLAAGKAAVISATAAVVFVAGTVAYGTGQFDGHEKPVAGTVSARPAPTTTPPSALPSTPAPAPTTEPSGSTPASATPGAAALPGITSATFPVRAAFYYPWYSDNFTPGGSHYQPSAGYYSVDDPATVDRQIKDMQYGGLSAGISSWWGAGKREDRRLPLLMTEGAKLGFSWTVYYEEEAYANPSVATIRSDLEYLRTYSKQQTWLHIDGKPVIFVYGTSGDACAMATRWAQANQTEGYYLVLKVFGGYRNCADQPQGWHQYASSLDIQKGYSAILSPGFWKNDSATPVVPRDLARFRSDATAVATSGAPFQLVVTYNEWGEGTAAESATAWASASGHGAYLDILHQVFGAHPK